MRTLEQIRKDNESFDLLLVGMEDISVEMSSALKRNEKEVYDNFVKPISKRVMSRYLKIL